MTAQARGSRWREVAAPIVADVLARVGRDDPAALRRALVAAYPFLWRRGWPYQVWLAECRRQLAGPPCAMARRSPVADCPGQLTLW